jgi:hypothetical protein
MAQPFTPEVVRYVVQLVGGYIEDQRNHFRPIASALSHEQRQPVAGYVSPALLDSIRVHQLAGTRIPDPSFYSTARALGITNLPPFSRMGAITFVDVIVAVELLSASTLFHELVHAIQYDILGRDAFAKQYVDGFLAGGSYEAIPLELNAYTLQARFDDDERFQADAEVRQWLAAQP